MIGLPVDPCDGHSHISSVSHSIWDRTHRQTDQIDERQAGVNLSHDNESSQTSGRQTSKTRLILQEAFTLLMDELSEESCCSQKKIEKVHTDTKTGARNNTTTAIWYGVCRHKRSDEIGHNESVKLLSVTPRMLADYCSKPLGMSKRLPS